MIISLCRFSKVFYILHKSLFILLVIIFSGILLYRGYSACYVLETVILVHIFLFHLREIALFFASSKYQKNYLYPHKYRPDYSKNIYAAYLYKYNEVNRKLGFYICILFSLSGIVIFLQDKIISDSDVFIFIVASLFGNAGVLIYRSMQQSVRCGGLLAKGTK